MGRNVAAVQEFQRDVILDAPGRRSTDFPKLTQPTLEAAWGAYKALIFEAPQVTTLLKETGIQPDAHVGNSLSKQCAGWIVRTQITCQGNYLPAEDDGIADLHGLVLGVDGGLYETRRMLRSAQREALKNPDDQAQFLAGRALGLVALHTPENYIHTANLQGLDEATAIEGCLKQYVQDQVALTFYAREHEAAA